MDRIDEDQEEEFGREPEQPPMLEVASRGNTADVERFNIDPSSPSKPLLVMAPEISSWDNPDGSFNLE